MTKVNPNNGNETKSDIFSWSIFKSDAIFFLSKILKSNSHIQKKLFIRYNKTPLKMMENAFYLIVKALFALKILKFLS